MKTVRIFTIIFCTMVLNVGFGQVKVSSDYDTNADFKSFKTYQFTEEALALPLNDLNRKRLIEAIESEMAKKGITKAEDADLWVDIKVSSEMKESTTATTDYYGTGYRYRWGPQFTTTNINVTEYVQGTIFIDFINNETDQLVWQGRGIGTVSENITGEKRTKRIQKAIAKIFKKYPPKIKK